MKPADLTLLLDRLDRGAAARRASTQNLEPPPPLPEYSTGLRFAVGARVVLMTTGQRGVVLAGVRVPDSGEVYYSVELAIGGSRVSQERELELDRVTLAPPVK